MENFRHKINNFESPISPDLFDNIMAERNKKKRGFAAGFWLLGIGALALLTVTVYQFYGVNDTKITAAKTTTTTKPNSLETTKKLKYNHQITDLQTPATSSPNLTKPTSSDRKFIPKTINSTIFTPKSQENNIFEESSRQTNQQSTFVKTVAYSPKNRVALSPSIPLPTLLPTALLAAQPTVKYGCPNNDCYAFNGRIRNGNSKLFIDLLGSPDFVNRKLSAKSSEFASYQKSRIATENYEFSYSAQLGIGLETGSGIVIRSGINYSQFESRFRKSDTDYKKVTIEQIFDNQGNPIRIDTVVTYGALDIQHYNTHKYIGIPLSLGYTTSGRKLDVGFNVGAQFNIQTTSTGRFIGTNLQTTDFAQAINGNKPAYKTKLGIQGIANITFAYEIGDHFDIILAPHVKFSPKTITTNDYPLNEKLTTTGLWIGGRIRF